MMTPAQGVGRVRGRGEGRAGSTVVALAFFKFEVRMGMCSAAFGTSTSLNLAAKVFTSIVHFTCLI
jgi:hypothetical protein